MTDPVIAAKAPVGVAVEAGKSYWWCTCGRSARQPFCDGSHKGTEFTPQQYVAPETRLCAMDPTKASEILWRS